jgi:hypothetical protein
LYIFSDFALQGNNGPLLMASNNVDARVEIDVSFMMSALYGVFLCIYGLVAFAIFYEDLVIVIGTGFSTMTSDLWYWSFLPFLAFLTDRMICAMFQQVEETRSLLLKVILWLFYLLYPTLFFSEDSEAYIISNNIMNLVCPPLFILLTIFHYHKYAKYIRLV